MEMPTSDYNTCKEFAEMDGTILGAAIIEDMEISALYSKQNTTLPKGEKFRQMVIQSEMFVRIAKANADFFGRLRYAMASFETFDSLFFSLPQGANNKVRTLVIRVSRPYDVTKLLERLHIT
jgi:hypothetical protein